MRGGHLLKHWSSTQQTVALSSGEAELKGIVKGAAEGIGMQNLAKYLSIYYGIHLYTDSSAAMGMVARKGMAKVRHIEVGELWIQDAVRNKVLIVNKVKGDDNPADILTNISTRVRFTNTATACGLCLRVVDRIRPRLPPVSFYATCYSQWAVLVTPGATQGLGKKQSEVHTEAKEEGEEKQEGNKEKWRIHQKEQRHKEDKNFFMNETEDIYVMKTVNALNKKFANSVARQNLTPHWNQPTRSIGSWVAHEGLVGGARA